MEKDWERERQRAGEAEREEKRGRLNQSLFPNLHPCFIYSLFHLFSLYPFSVSLSMPLPNCLSVSPPRPALLQDILLQPSQDQLPTTKYPWNSSPALSLTRSLTNQTLLAEQAYIQLCPQPLHLPSWIGVRTLGP